MSLGINSMPASLLEAINELKENEVMQKMLGTHAYEKFVEGKLEEWDDYRVRVHDWEIGCYLNAY
jgi:glutamine synthetase